jgi:hypothetical protein
MAWYDCSIDCFVKAIQKKKKYQRAKAKLISDAKRHFHIAKHTKSNDIKN